MLEKGTNKGHDSASKKGTTPASVAAASIGKPSMDFAWPSPSNPKAAKSGSKDAGDNLLVDRYLRWGWGCTCR